jgi:hypothetical protein
MGKSTLRATSIGARRSRALLVLTFAASAASCEGGYTLPPTACDDWCFATQRAGCSEDYPDDCVSRCEDESVLERRPDCEATRRELTECYLEAPSSEFRCVEGVSTPMGICFDARIRVGECISPLVGACIQSCIAQAVGCDRLAPDCEHCSRPTPGCESEELALYACQLRGPADCQDPETDTRSAEEIPCIAEIDALLRCAGFTPDE